jgi:hypothetical protein
MQDGSGTIDFEEFLQMMTAKMGERDSREEIMKAFKLFDDDNTGFITLKNLKRVAKELGENLTDEELQVGLVTGFHAFIICACTRAGYNSQASALGQTESQVVNETSPPVCPCRR